MLFLALPKDQIITNGDIISGSGSPIRRRVCPIGI